MRVLFISNLFPDSTEPYRGLDNAALLHHLARRCEIRVVSPRPTLPLLAVKRVREARPEDMLFQPMYPTVAYAPKIGSRINHYLFGRMLRTVVPAMQREFPFEAILCSWAYPDVCGVALLVERMNVPFVAIVQGTDVHHYLNLPVRKRLIVAALNRASGVIARSGDLARRLESAGVDKEKLNTIYNGVDSTVFKAGDRSAARGELGLPADAEVALFVGNFYPVKDPLLSVSAFAEWAGGEIAGRRRLLIMVGGGPMERVIKKAVRAAGMDDRLILTGRQIGPRVARYMQAADLLLLTSVNEGLPNVILEAISSGLPVVATNVGGISEVLSSPDRGCLVDSREPRAIATAIEKVMGDVSRCRGATIETRAPFQWETTAEKYLALLRRQDRLR